MTHSQPPHHDISRHSNQKFPDFQIPPKLLKGVMDEDVDEEDLRDLMRELRLQQESGSRGAIRQQRSMPPDGTSLESTQFWKDLLMKAQQDEDEQDVGEYNPTPTSHIERRQQISNSMIRRELQRRQQSEPTRSPPAPDSRANDAQRRLSSSSSQYNNNTPDNASSITETNLSYTLNKFRKEYMELREKYRSSLDVAFVFSNLLHQQQLYTEQLKKSYANREIEITTLKQNIEALNSALKRSQKVVAADRQKQAQLLDKLMQDYDHVMRSLTEKRELLDIIEQQKNHILQQSQMIDVLKRELEIKSPQDETEDQRD